MRNGHYKAKQLYLKVKKCLQKWRMTLMLVSLNMLNNRT